MQTKELSTTTERLDGDRVKLRVEVPETSLAAAIDAVYRRWAQEIKVPGFRKGKVPRQLIDARVGPGAVRAEALHDALPGLYLQAMEAESLEAIAPPDIEVVAFDEGAPLVFEATVELRPDIQVPDLTAINVDAPPAEVTDEELTDQLDRLRDRFAELETASRDARRGDFVLIDLNGHQNDQPVEGASAPDLLYEVGSHSGPPKLDAELEGNRAGAILKFTDQITEGELAGQDVSFTVLIKEVKAKKLPSLDDDFAKTVGEFDTLEALKDDLRTRLAEMKGEWVAQEIRSRALAAVVDASSLVAPDKLVESEFEHRLEHFEEDLKRAGLRMADYERQAQLTELEIRRDLRAHAERSVKAELLLEQIARDQGLDASEEDIGREVAMLAARLGRDPKEVAEQIVKSGRLRGVAADVIRRKALDYATEHVNVVGVPLNGG